MSERLTDTEIRQALEREPKAFDELLRVTGMGKYACRPQGGPPQPRRATIPADPERDTDLLIGASLDDLRAVGAEALARGEEIAQLRRLLDLRGTQIADSSEDNP